MTSSSSSPRVNAPWPSRTDSRSASIRISSLGPSSAITMRIALDPASIAPRVVRPGGSACKLARVRPRRGDREVSRSRLLLRRRLLRAARAGALSGLRRTGVVGDLELVGRGDAVEHLDLDAVGQTELDRVLDEGLRRGVRPPPSPRSWWRPTGRPGAGC